MGQEINGKSPQAQRMLKFAFNLLDDGLVGQQLFAGEATRLAYMTDEAVEGRDAFLEKRDPDWSPFPDTSSRAPEVRRDNRGTAPETAPNSSHIDSAAVNPLRRITEAIALTGMRPPLSLPTGITVDLRGKRVLITGASSGIGAAGAEQFAAEGCEVIVVARREDLLAEVVDRITAAGGAATAIPCDLADLDAVDALAQQVGAVDILVNNAGRSIRRPLAESLDRWHDVERTMMLNYFRRCAHPRAGARHAGAP